MSPSAHLLILASAGTGKTWCLTNRFLTLLFDGVAPERILATTFTRKAAGEILDRVLARLAEACESQAACDELSRDLKRSGLSRESCLQLLGETVRQLNTFQIRTIDSFFVHLAKLFALDLELPPGWSIADERVDNRIRSEALLDLLAEDSGEERGLLIREILKHKPGRRIHQALLDQVKALRSIHLEASPDAWDSLDVGPQLGDAALRLALDKFAGADLPLTAKKQPHRSWKNAHGKVLENLAAADWEAVIGAGLGAKFLAGETYCSIDFSEDLRASMQPLMDHACGQFLREIRARNLAASNLLDSFEEAYQARKRDTGSYGFSDLPHALAPRGARALPLDERELDLWFRLDGRIDHLLLDEFQDTAPVQWRILAPIAEEITAEGDGTRSFFCVGDAKQSIYAFRQAEPRLLSNLSSMLPALEEDNVLHLNKSYRSSSIVLETVNLVFTDLAQDPIFDAAEYLPFRQACHEFELSFETHEAAKQLPGAAYLIEAREPGTGKRHASLCEMAVERVALMREEAPGATVGVLTRTRKLIPTIIYALRKRGIDASGEGGNVLTDARSVQIFLSLLHFADFPDDSAAAFHVATSPFGPYIDLLPDASRATQRAKSMELREKLARLGLAAFVAEYGEHMARDEQWTAWDRTRFGQLQDLAFGFESCGEERPSAFVDHVRECRVEAPGGAAVRVMTIHASKGLEFDAVILPELGSTFIPVPASVLVNRPLPQELIQGATLPPKKGMASVSPGMQSLFHNQTMRMVGDNLCVLYVAMTRAVHRLELIVPWIDPDGETDKAGKSPRFCNLLRNRLSSANMQPDENGVLWSHEAGAAGSAWFQPKAEQSAPPASEARPELSLAAFRRARSLPRRRPSADSSAERGVLDALGSSKGARIGTLTHALLEPLEWAETFELEHALSHPALRRASKLDAEKALEIAQRALETPAIFEALSLQACSAPASLTREVHSEFDFSLLDDGELWNGSIDRLVLARESGRVVWAEIIDYKTDHITTGGLAARVEHHRPQLERYANVIRELHDLEPSAIHCRLLFLAAGEVCSLE